VYVPFISPIVIRIKNFRSDWRGFIGEALMARAGFRTETTFQPKIFDAGGACPTTGSCIAGSVKSGTAPKKKDMPGVISATSSPVGTLKIFR
jgi:hypothetical protein